MRDRMIFTQLKSLNIVCRFLWVVGVCFASIFSPLSTGALADSQDAELAQISDSIGNVNTNSWGKHSGGNWSCDPNCPDLVLNLNESLWITAQGSDPNGLPLEYDFAIQTSTGSFETVQAWSSNSAFFWNITPEYYGQTVVVKVSVRNNDGVERFGMNGDDYTYATYEIIDPDHPYATLLWIEDSLGNKNTNSASKHTGTRWSCEPNCTRLHVNSGEHILVSAYGFDPASGPLEYRFSKYVSGSEYGSEVVQDWGPISTYPWDVSYAEIGRSVEIMVSVRNGDALNYQGYLGDDYTFAIYQVDVPPADGPTIQSLSDDRGNWTQFSTAKQSGAVCRPGCTEIAFAGKTIQYTVAATDPYERPLEYRFQLFRPDGSMALLQDWSAANTASWAVSSDEYGHNYRIRASIRNNDGVRFLGEDGDDYADLFYTVAKSDYPNLTLAYVRDRFGNVNLNSMNKGATGWSCTPNCYRTKVTPKDINIDHYIVFASSAGTGEEWQPGIQYNCWLHLKDGTWFSRAGWGGNNYCELNVRDDMVAGKVEIRVGVKDADENNPYGEWGDDYTDLTYNYERWLFLPIISSVK